jgi:hypothetical protein
MGSLLFQEGMVITPLTIGAEIEFIHRCPYGKREERSPLSPLRERDGARGI